MVSLAQVRHVELDREHVEFIKSHFHMRSPE